MNIFWRQAIEKSSEKIFSRTLYFSDCSKTRPDWSGLSIAPTPDRIGHVEAKNDTIEKSCIKRFWDEMIFIYSNFDFSFDEVIAFVFEVGSAERAP